MYFGDIPERKEGLRVMKINRFPILLMSAALAITVLGLTACDQLQAALGETAGVTISGSVLVPGTMPESGTVWVGIADYDPESNVEPANPFPWAGFSGSSVQVGLYTKGTPATFQYKFTDVPKGYYFIAAIVDTNSNGRLDWSGDGYILEALAVYPDRGGGEPYLMKFDSEHIIPSITTTNPFVTVSGTIQFDGTVTHGGTILVGMLDIDIEQYQGDNPPPFPQYLTFADYPNSSVDLGSYTALDVRTLDFTLQRVPRGRELWVGVVVDANENGKVDMDITTYDHPVPVEAVGFYPVGQDGPTRTQFTADTTIPETIGVMDPSEFIEEEPT
jgi:uncharacterized protein (DUF2141 family)